MIKKEKILVLSLLGILFISVCASFVVAASVSDISNSISSYFSNLSAQNNTGLLRILFSVLIFLISFNLVGFIPTIGKNKLIKLIFTLVITFISIFFMPADLISSIIKPWEAWGGAVLTIIPFLLMFGFIHSLRNTFLKSAAWFMFGLILLALFISAWIKEPASIVSYIYGGGVILCILASFIWNRIEKAIWKGALEDTMNAIQKRSELIQNYRSTQAREAINEAKESKSDVERFAEQAG